MPRGYSSRENSHLPGDDYPILQSGGLEASFQQGYSVGRLQQPNYYEDVVRDDRELNRMRDHILNNSAQWETDDQNPASRIT